MTTATLKVEARFPKPHEEQHRFVTSVKKRNVVRAGRRSGKTTGLGIRAGYKFLIHNKRVLYGAPTADQLATFWAVVKKIFEEPIDRGVLYKNETRHIIENPATGARIRAKTCYNAETLRGDYADELILDEWQLMNEDAWDTVGQPMLIDNDGTATFLYTPPGLNNRAISRARDKRHAAKMYKAALEDPEWGTFHFPTSANPVLSKSGIARAFAGMTPLNRRLEIEAEDVDEAPNALWKRELFERDGFRLNLVPANLTRVVVAVDPTGSKRGDECGIVVSGRAPNGHGYVLEDASEGGLSPEEWGSRVIECYHAWRADMVVGEINFGGDMVESTLRAIDHNIPFKPVSASRGKAVRAEPVSALYSRNLVHHCGEFAELEDQQCLWTPDTQGWSPDRMDALVWGITDLLLESAWSSALYDMVTEEDEDF